MFTCVWGKAARIARSIWSTRASRREVATRRGAIRAKASSMPAPVDITFRSMTTSPAVEHSISGWVDRLEHTFGRIERCSVVIEIPHNHQQRAKVFHVRLEVSIPEHMIIVSRDGDRLTAALSEAFRAARRQLSDRAHILRGEVKMHS